MCGKVFHSFPALDGHRTSHKKNEDLSEQKRSVGTKIGNHKTHECPICYKVFGSGQALGGHKKSHVLNGSNATSFSHTKPPLKSGETLIDLNLPAPIDDVEISQIELSAVSDSEFINPMKH